MNKLKAIGVISHRTNPECYPSFEVTTCRTEYNFGSYYLLGVRADGGTYSVMAASWKFNKYANLSNKDDDDMNKESEIIDELIEDERHDCETQPEKTEWAVGDKPPVNVWLDCVGMTSGTSCALGVRPPNSSPPITAASRSCRSEFICSVTIMLLPQVYRMEYSG